MKVSPFSAFNYFQSFARINRLLLLNVYLFGAHLSCCFFR